MEWLSKMIESPTWRKTIYELAQNPRNEDCPFLSLAMPCIAVEEDLFGELISVPLAWNTLEIFLKCALYVLQPLLAVIDVYSEGLFESFPPFLVVQSDNQIHPDHPSIWKDISDICFSNYISEEKIPILNRARTLFPNFLEMGCYSEHNYLIFQIILHNLAKQSSKASAAKKLAWTLEAEAIKRNKPVFRYSVYFCDAHTFPDCMEAMQDILRERCLTPQSISTLKDSYQLSDSKGSHPSVSLLQHPIFITLLADALFSSPDRMLKEQIEDYAYLYSFASIVKQDSSQKSSKVLDFVNKAKMAVIETSKICKQWNNMSGSGVSVRAFRDLPVLLQNLTNYNSISFGIFRFLRIIFHNKKVDFELNFDIMRPYCIVLNEIATSCHSLHPAILALIVEMISSNADEAMVDLSQLECKRSLVSVLVHLISCGYTTPVIETMKCLHSKDKVDVSLVRYMVVELLAIASPPYTLKFMKALFPLVNQPDINQSNLTNTGRESEYINEFLEYFEDNCPPDLKEILTQEMVVDDET